MTQTIGAVSYDVELDTAKLISGGRKVDRELDRLGGEGDKLQARFTKISAAIGAALSAIAVEGLVSKLIGAQRQFDVMFASLKTVTGGADQAGAVFERLTKFAAQTPYSLDQAVKGFVKLRAMGLNPSERAMTSFGNTAAAMGKDLSQMIEAVADASTSEFERLKEFGIKAKVEGDNVSLTFRGTTTTVRNSSEQIVEYLTKIGETDFAGAMSERTKTLDGDISNLEDSLASLYLTISKSGFGDAVAAGVRKATEVIQELSTSVKEGGLTEYFDALKPYIKAAEVAVVALAGAITSRLIGAFVASAVQAYASAAAVGAATVAARGFTAVVAAMGGPIGIAITGLALLALNWDKVAGEARDAATISEQAAERIANALKKSPGRAQSDLASQLKDARDEIALIDKELSRTAFPKASDADIAELKQRRDVLVKVAADIGAAMDKLHGGAGRGKVNPDLVVPDQTGGGGQKKAKPTGEKFDSGGYLAGLEAKTLEGIARIDALEQEALRKNGELLKAGKITRAEAARAQTLIEENAASDRRDIMLREGEERRQLIEEQGKADAEARAKVAADQARGQGFAQGILTDADPVAKLQAELEAKTALLMQYAAIDQANASLYAAARVALEAETNEKIAEIVRRRRDQQAAENSATLQNYGSLFGGLADLTKTFAGEQSSAYKAIFAVSKGFAIADAVLRLQMALMQAMADPTAITPAQKFANYAAVLAAGSGVLGAIKSATFGGGRQYGGPVSADSLYRVNETGRPEMFQGSNGAQYILPTSGGRVIPADQVGGAGGPQWQIVVNNNAPGAVASASVDQQSRVVTIAIAEVAAQIRENSGSVWSALRSATNVTGRMS